MKNKNLKYFSQGTWVIEHYFFIRFLAYILPFFKNIHPNFITFLSFLLVLFSSFLIIKWYIFIWLFLYFLFPFLDLLDWAIARKFNKKSIFWAIFDGFIDTIWEIIILISLWFYFNQIIIFLFLVIFILLVQLLSIRIKWIINEKERQLDFRNIKNPIKILIVIFTRNDTRKLILLILWVFWYWQLIVLYFWWLYLLSFIFSISKILLVKK